MKKNLKFLPLIMMMPFLMANSPAREPSVTRYDDIDVYIDYVGIDTSRYISERAVYDVKIVNTGDEYIVPAYGLYLSNDEVYYSFGLEKTNQIFDSQLIAPGKSEQFKIYTSESTNLNQPFTPLVHSLYKRMDDVKIVNPKIKKAKEDKTYTFVADNKNLEKRAYALAVDATYKEQNVSFYVHYEPSSRTFRTNEELDLDKLTINNVKVYEDYEYNRGCNGSFNSFVIVMSMFFLMVLGGILTPIIITSSRRMRRHN